MKAIITSLFFLITISAIAQFGQLKSFHYNNASENITKAKELVFTLLNKRTRIQQKIPYRYIQVIDARFDTSKLGYLEKDIEGSRYCRIVLKDQWEELLNSYFKEILDPQAEQSLLLVIHTYWIQHSTLGKVKVDGNNQIINDQFTGGHTSTDIDVYIKDEKLQPFFQFDYNFLWGEKLKDKNLPNHVLHPFDTLIKKIILSNVKSTGNKNTIVFSELIRFYKERRNQPISTGTSVEGVYYSFDDFKQNKIRETDLLIEKDGDSYILYKVINNKKEPITNYFGFSDGKDIYLKGDFGFHKAVKQQNTYEIFAMKMIKAYLIINSIDTPTKPRVIGTKEEILQLNMKTGKFY